MTKQILFPLICAISPAVPAAAQTVTFDTDDYKAVSVYDSWVESPLRTGKLAGNVQVIDNFLAGENAAIDATPKIVGLQRSRYAGNLQGIRVDLKETFRLTKEERYVHVLVCRPVEDSRVMLITLGKRSERAGQESDVEQTWSLARGKVGADGWYDAVFAIKGFSSGNEAEVGIDIYSLVVCPDVADRSSLTEDFACYIDQIEINDSPKPRFGAVNGGADKQQSQQRHADWASVAASQLNGDIYVANDMGTPLLNYKVRHGDSLRIKIVPAPGFTCSGIRVRHGSNLEDETYYPVEQFTKDELTLPPNIFDCDRVELEGYMVPVSQATGNALETVLASYKLAFSDDFSDEKIDRDKWASSPRKKAVWSRFIAEDPRVSFLRDGALVCRALANNDLAADTASMLSGALQTSNSYGLLYGYVEVRAKTTPHAGNFPAIWLMPMDQSDRWPACGEIDIWETINTEATTYHTVHSRWTKLLGNTMNPPHSGRCNFVMDGEWHTYGLLKEAERLTWYVDGAEVFSYAKSSDPMALSAGQWPFDKEFYLILNQSVGDGSWADTYDASFTYETLFDWVRIYEAPDTEMNKIGETDI